MTDKVGDGLQQRRVHFINADTPEESCPVSFGDVNEVMQVISLLWDHPTSRYRQNKEHNFLLVFVVLNSYRQLASPEQCGSVGYD